MSTIFNSLLKLKKILKQIEIEQEIIISGFLKVVSLFLQVDIYLFFNCHLLELVRCSVAMEPKRLWKYSIYCF